MYHFVRYLLCKYLLFKCGEFSRQKTLPVNWALIYLLSLIISISEEVNKQSFIVCIVFQQYLLNKPQKFRVPQSILFASN